MVEASGGSQSWQPVVEPVVEPVVVEPVVEYSEAALEQLGVEDPTPNQVAAVAFPVNALVLVGLGGIYRRM